MTSLTKGYLNVTQSAHSVIFRSCLLDSSDINHLQDAVFGYHCRWEKKNGIRSQSLLIYSI